MSDVSQTAWIWAARGAGAAAGSAISIAYVLPEGRREAAVRFAVGVIAGLVFGGAAGIKVAAELGIDGRIGPVEQALIGAAVASLSAWWLIGLGLKWADRLLRRHRGTAERDGGPDVG